MRFFKKSKKNSKPDFEKPEINLIEELENKSWHIDINGSLNLHAGHTHFLKGFKTQIEEIPANNFIISLNHVTAFGPHKESFEFLNIIKNYTLKTKGSVVLVGLPDFMSGMKKPRPKNNFPYSYGPLYKYADSPIEAINLLREIDNFPNKHSDLQHLLVDDSDRLLLMLHSYNSKKKEDTIDLYGEIERLSAGSFYNRISSIVELIESKLILNFEHVFHPNFDLVYATFALCKLYSDKKLKIGCKEKSDYIYSYLKMYESLDEKFGIKFSDILLC